MAVVIIRPADVTGLSPDGGVDVYVTGLPSDGQHWLVLNGGEPEPANATGGWLSHALPSADVAAGSNTLAVHAGNAGAPGAVLAEKTFTIEPGRPKARLNAPTPGQALPAGEPVFVVLTADPGTYDVLVGGAVVGAVTTTDLSTPAYAEVPAPAVGARTFDIRKTGTATVLVSAAVTVAAALTAPVVTAPVAGSTVTGVAVVKGTAPAGTNVWVQEDSVTLGVAPVTAGAFTVTLDDPLEPGEHSLHVFAVDAGGASSAETILAVTVVAHDPRRGPIPIVTDAPGPNPHMLGEYRGRIPYGEALYDARRSYDRQRRGLPAGWAARIRSAVPSVFRRR